MSFPPIAAGTLGRHVWVSLYSVRLSSQHITTSLGALTFSF